MIIARSSDIMTYDPSNFMHSERNDAHRVYTIHHTQYVYVTIDSMMNNKNVSQKSRIGIIVESHSCLSDYMHINPDDRHCLTLSLSFSVPFYFARADSKIPNSGQLQE